MAVLALEYCGPVSRDLLDLDDCHLPRAVGALERLFFHATRWALSTAAAIEIFLLPRGTQMLEDAQNGMAAQYSAAIGHAARGDTEINSALSHI